MRRTRSTAGGIQLADLCPATMDTGTTKYLISGLISDHNMVTDVNNIVTKDNWLVVHHDRPVANANAKVVTNGSKPSINYKKVVNGNKKVTNGNKRDNDNNKKVANDNKKVANDLTWGKCDQYINKLQSSGKHIKYGHFLGVQTVADMQ